MKISNSVFNSIILMIGVVLTVVLTQAGCQQATKQKEVQTDGHAGHEHSEEETKKPPFMQVEDAQLTEDANLDEVVAEAVENIKVGRENNDMMLVMNGGIMKLRAVLDRDPNHEQAIYHLGMMSIESGQLQKAEKRFEKLVLLQPENQDYADKLADIRAQLGK